MLDGLSFAIRRSANGKVSSPTSRFVNGPGSATRIGEASWPRGVISLSHVALPFPPDDPLYGAERPDDSGQLYLGQLAIRGERGLMLLSSDWLLRLRHNPFYAVQEKRIIDWVAATSD